MKTKTRRAADTRARDRNDKKIRLSGRALSQEVNSYGSPLITRSLYRQ